MISIHASRVSTLFMRWPLFLLAIGLGPLLVLGPTPPVTAAESGTSNQCNACHTDAAKLKALTPPDPTSSEEGEG